MPRLARSFKPVRSRPMQRWRSRPVTTAVDPGNSSVSLWHNRSPGYRWRQSNENATTNGRSRQAAAARAQYSSPTARERRRRTGILDLLRELVVTFVHVDLPEPEKAPVVTLARSRADLSA